MFLFVWDWEKVSGRIIDSIILTWSLDFVPASLFTACLKGLLVLLLMLLSLYKVNFPFQVIFSFQLSLSRSYQQLFCA